MDNFLFLEYIQSIIKFAFQYLCVLRKESYQLRHMIVSVLDQQNTFNDKNCNISGVHMTTKLPTGNSIISAAWITEPTKNFRFDLPQ